LNGDVSDFQQYFKLPFAGRRSFSVAKAEEKNN
jgi:hypothetical protein